MTRRDDSLDWSAAGALFVNYRAPLERFLRSRLGPSDAEEVLQELWIKSASLELSRIADPLAYLFRMAENMARNHHRSSDRHVRRDDAWAQMHMAQGPQVEAPSVLDFETELITREKLRRVESALETLPPRTASIFRAFRVDGLAQKAIAEQHGISLSAVEKHLQRAYQLVVAVQAELDADIATPRCLGAEGTGNDEG